jgi:uncharacterized membrane protein (GlpM family)
MCFLTYKKMKQSTLLVYDYIVPLKRPRPTCFAAMLIPFIIASKRNKAMEKTISSSLMSILRKFIMIKSYYLFCVITHQDNNHMVFEQYNNECHS